MTANYSQGRTRSIDQMPDCDSAGSTVGCVGGTTRETAIGKTSRF